MNNALKTSRGLIVLLAVVLVCCSVVNMGVKVNLLPSETSLTRKVNGTAVDNDRYFNTSNDSQEKVDGNMVDALPLEETAPSQLKSFWSLKQSGQYNIGKKQTSVVVNETLGGVEVPVEIAASNWGNVVSRAAVESKIQEMYEGKGPPAKVDIDHVYYINLDNRNKRRAVMETWLNRLPIEHQRVSALRGNTTTCVKNKKGKRCAGVSGLIYSNLHIMDNLNVSGLTLVLEDDFVVRDMKKLIASINLAPDDWDVLRWDCWGKPLKQFEVKHSVFKAGPVDESKCGPKENCWYCGGTHATLWREESIQKLKSVWGKQPHDAIDCRLADPSLKSYCIQVGVGEYHHVLSEYTDIPKN